MIPPESEVVVIGGGPAGLATSACLKSEGVRHVLLERETVVASAWRRHYDRLHLHTSRAFSGLPHYPMPRDYPRYPSRDQVVRYLEAYARAVATEPTLGVEVTGVRHEGSVWIVESSVGAVRSAAVVVATGVNGEPVMPSWPGLDTFPGPVMHSGSYENAEPFAGRDVLVVGFGNSGGEISLDLLEHGATPTVSIRSPVNVVPRDVLGLPLLALAIPLAALPPRVADVLSWPILKAHYPSYSRLGLRKARRGPFQQIASDKRIPLLDIGTVEEIRRGRIRVVGDVVEIAGPRVKFRAGGTRTFDAIVLATGYRPCLPGGVALRRPDDRSVTTPGPLGLYFCGFYISPTGMLREIGIEAREIAARIASQVAHG